MKPFQMKWRVIILDEKSSAKKNLSRKFREQKMQLSFHEQNLGSILSKNSFLLKIEQKWKETRYYWRSLFYAWNGQFWIYFSFLLFFSLTRIDILTQSVLYTWNGQFRLMSKPFLLISINRASDRTIEQVKIKRSRYWERFIAMSEK